MYYYVSNYPYHNFMFPYAHSNPNNHRKSVGDLDFVPADDPSQYLNLIATGSKKLIRTYTNWENFVKENPLNIDLELLNRFGKELIFLDNGGFVSANYQIVANSLTFEQFRRLFGYLGISMKFFEDHRDYICEAGDCRSYTGYVCNTTLCSRLVNSGNNNSNLEDNRPYCYDPYGRIFGKSAMVCFPNNIVYQCIGGNRWDQTDIPCIHIPPSNGMFGMEYS